MDDKTNITENPPKQNRKLTIKQLKFCHNVVKCEGNASEAYRQSYDAVTSNNKTIWKEAQRLIQNPLVTPMIENLQEKLQNKLVITTETQIQKLQDIYIDAMADKEYAPAISAINSQSKHLGLIADKPSTTININLQEAEKQLRTVSPEKRAAMLELMSDEFEEV